MGAKICDPQVHIYLYSLGVYGRVSLVIAHVEDADMVKCGAVGF